MPALTTGTTLKHGTFQVVSFLGRGGFGEVYLARQTRIERDVAIKVLLPHVSENADVVTRFQREALAAATLLHPNVLTVFDFDFDDDTRARIAAELSTIASDLSPEPSESLPASADSSD